MRDEGGVGRILEKPTNIYTFLPRMRDKGKGVEVEFFKVPDILVHVRIPKNI